jgi:hypothetical protein
MTQFLTAELFASASVPSGSGSVVVLTVPLTTVFALASGQAADVRLQIYTDQTETFNVDGFFLGGNLSDPYSFGGTVFANSGLNGSSDYEVKATKQGSAQVVRVLATVRLFGTGYTT